MRTLATLAAIGGALILAAPAQATIYPDQCTRSLMGSTSGWWAPDDDVTAEWNRYERTGIDIVSAYLSGAHRINADAIYEWWIFGRANGSTEATRLDCYVSSGQYHDIRTQTSRSGG
jgi:hypothetical protein